MSWRWGTLVILAPIGLAAATAHATDKPAPCPGEEIASLSWLTTGKIRFVDPVAPQMTGRVQLQEAAVLIPFAAVPWGSWELASAGWAGWTRLDFAGYADLNTEDLYGAALALSIEQPIRQRWGWNAILMPGFYGEARFMGQALACCRLADAWRLELGVAWDDAFGEPRLFPVGGVVWQPVDAFTARLLFPAPALNWAPTRRLNVYTFLQPSGDRWANWALRGLQWSGSGPGSRGKVHELVARVVHEAAEDVGHVGPRIDLLEAATSHDGKDHRRGPCATLASGKQPVLAADDRVAEVQLGTVVVRRDFGVVEEHHQALPLVQRVLDRLPDGASGADLVNVFEQPAVDVVEGGGRPLLADPGPDLEGTLGDLAFDVEEHADLPQRLVSQRGARVVGVVEVPAGMRPAPGGGIHSAHAPFALPIPSLPLRRQPLSTMLGC